ncbi:hypothetical protein EVG20_g10396 [Dentipellis fragilis]|uniref:Uncharacterized protein n=1 Tax=Dentipellis fragilis TaxID=205917 RepID=A0A4Y9XW68_9AGAM|nr:hypothetical protein EVG20_g10396 [Dentipellis fragilis]
MTVFVILRARSEHGVLAHWLLLFTLLLMMILATLHVTLALFWVFEGFILKPEFPGGPLMYFGDVHNPIVVAKDAVLLVQALLGDNIYIWRCYIVWGRRKRMIVVPVITMMIAMVFACISDYNLAHIQISIFDEPSTWTKGFSAFMLATIVYCNVAIIWQIWRTTNGSRTSATLIVLIETGALYTANLIAYLLLNLNELAALYISLDLFGPLVPIVFCLIILQIKYHRARDTSTSVTTAPNGSGFGMATFGAIEHCTSQHQKKQRSDIDTITEATLSNSDSMYQPTEICIEMPQNVVRHHIYVGKTETRYFEPERGLQPDVSGHSGDDLSIRTGKM